MATSQNGFSANDRKLIQTVLVPGTDVKLPVRRGAAGDLLIWAATRWHREVEPLRAADGVLDCWGYAERTVRGSDTVLSNHASGTAIDLRARAHPLGAAGTFTAPQVAAIHRIIADCRGALRWGGDYTGRKDEMHLEVLASENTCALILAKLTAPPAPPAPPEVDMPLTANEIAAIADAVWLRGRPNYWGDVVAPLQVLNGSEARVSDVQNKIAAPGGVDLDALAGKVVDLLAARLGR